MKAPNSHNTLWFARPVLLGLGLFVQASLLGLPLGVEPPGVMPDGGPFAVVSKLSLWIQPKNRGGNRCLSPAGRPEPVQHLHQRLSLANLP